MFWIDSLPWVRKLYIALNVVQTQRLLFFFMRFSFFQHALCCLNATFLFEAMFFGNMAGPSTFVRFVKRIMRTTAPLRRLAAALILTTMVPFSVRVSRADAENATANTAAVDIRLPTADKRPAVGQKDFPQNTLGLAPSDQKLSDVDYHSLRDDDAWLISTRHLDCLAGKGESTLDLDVSRFSTSGEWIPAGVDTLLSSEPRLTVVYVHGNRVSDDEAISRAWQAFGVLQRDPAAPPMRLIIWSWPSDRIHGQVRDVRYKAARTNTEGHYLGWFLAQIDPETSVNLIGFSYGARVVTGAMHVLSGGRLACAAPDIVAGDRRPIQVVLVAAALHNHWLSSGGFHEGFWQFADRLLLLFNSCDPVLKRYRFIEKRGRPVALGYRGSWGLSDDLEARIEERDVCCSVGKTHSESVFFSSAEVIDGIQQHLLTRDAPE